MKNQVMLKIELLEKLERDLRIELDRIQLQFILSDKYINMYTTPRRYGKDLMISTRAAINGIAMPNRKILIVSMHENCQRLIKTKIKSYLDILISDSNTVQIEIVNKNSIRLSNGSVIDFVTGHNFEFGIHGKREHEVLINEYMHNNMEEIYRLSRILTLCYASGQVLMVGTPYNSDFVRTMINSEYIEHIQVLNKHVPRLSNMLNHRDEMDTDTYRREILGEIV